MNDNLSNRQVLYGPAVPLFNYNHNHDPKNGQFTFADGSGGDNGRFTATGGMSGTITGQGTPLFPLYKDKSRQRDAKRFEISKDQSLLVPPGTDFNDVYKDGQKNGTTGMGAAVGHYGKFDFQRNKGKGYSKMGNIFYPDYTDASNFAVGVYLNGAGVPKNLAVATATAFAKSMSSNSGDPKQKDMWTKGWEYAQNNYNKKGR